MDTKGSRIIQSEKVDAIFISSPANMRAVSGFTGEGYLYISQCTQMVVTDFRYMIAAKEECPGWQIVDMNGAYFEPLVEILYREQTRLLGYEMEHITMHQFNQICNLYRERGKGKLEFQNIDSALRQMRMIKSDEEIHYIEKAEEIGDLAFEQILKELKVGLTEKEVAARLEFYMKSLGADGLSFDTIAASGIHSAMPHAVPTDKRLEEGDFLTLDFGCRYHGYCSDMTRTVVIGKADEKQKRLYYLVLEAQELVLQKVRPGMTGREVDAIARNFIHKAGYGNHFGHGLGHSVGLEIHESPSFSKREDRRIEPGMVITVEPGIYIEGFGGVRIEDVICMTESGCRNLTHSPKDLIEIN
mgnify:CR=1 FL=1